MQLACAKLCTAIDAPDLLDCRDGSRSGRGALEAVRALTFDLPYGRYGSLVEAEMTGFVEHMAQTGRLDMLRERLDDRALLHLLCKWLTAGIWDPEGQGVHPETGTPHGGTVSPVLAHVALPDALDIWCETVGQPRGRGEALVCREAADWGCACRWQADAARLLRVWPTRLAQCHRQVAPETTHLGRFSRFHPSKQRRFTLLGCEFCWTPERPGVPRVRRRPARKKRHAAGPRLTAGLKPHRHRPGRAFCPRLHAR